MRTARFAVPLLLVALLGAACGGGGNGGGGNGGGGETTDSVTMVDNEFQPSSFTAASDTITVSNEGQALHSFTVPDGAIDQDVQPGESADVDVSSLGAGTYDFECKYHPEMTGSMTID